MLFLTTRAKFECNHPPRGRADADANRQSFVRIQGAPVLTQNDSSRRSLKGCPLTSPLKKCTLTLIPDQGHSTFIRIAGAEVQLDPTGGGTDSTPPGRYSVADPGQGFVRDKS